MPATNLPRQIAEQVGTLARRILGADIEVYWYGSWVEGRAVARSDIDIGVASGHLIRLERLSRLRGAVEELPTLYTVDLVDLAAADPTPAQAGCGWRNSALSPRRAALRRALERLDEVLREDETPIIRDAAIQRFELCFELTWKAIQEAARNEGIDCASPRGCGRVAYRLGWIDDEAGWLAALEDRNLRSHMYDEKIFKDVYSRLSATVGPARSSRWRSSNCFARRSRRRWCFLRRRRLRQ